MRIRPGWSSAEEDLFVAFPMIYGVLFSGLYIPLLTFIFGLIFRGVTFEFRANATRKGPWNRAFFLGSLVAVIAQGLTLGGILSGTRVDGGQIRGRPLRLAEPIFIDGRPRINCRLYSSRIHLSSRQD